MSSSRGGWTRTRFAVSASRKGSYDNWKSTHYMKRNRMADDIFIAVMGVTGSGKSSFISLLSDDEVRVGHSLASCTTDVQLCPFDRGGHAGFLIDTPGFDDTTRSDTDILKEIAFLFNTLYKARKRLTGLIYLHRISDPRMQGSAVKNLQIFQKLCGTDAFPHVALVSTMWQTLEGKDRDTGVQRENTLVSNELFWGTMEKQGSTVMRHQGDERSALEIVEQLINISRYRQRKAVLSIQREMVDQGMTLDATTAGRYLQEEFTKLRERYEKDISGLQQSMKEAQDEKDSEAQELLSAQRKDFQTKLEATVQDRDGLEVDEQELEAEKGVVYKALVRQMEQERGNMQHVLTTRQKDLRRLEDEMEACKEDLESCKNEIKQQRKQITALARMQNAKTKDDSHHREARVAHLEERERRVKARLHQHASSREERKGLLHQSADEIRRRFPVLGLLKDLVFGHDESPESSSHSSPSRHYVLRDPSWKLDLATQGHR